MNLKSKKINTSSRAHQIKKKSKMKPTSYSVDIIVILSDLFYIFSKGSHFFLQTNQCLVKNSSHFHSNS